MLLRPKLSLRQDRQYAAAAAAATRQVSSVVPRKVLPARRPATEQQYNVQLLTPCSSSQPAFALVPHGSSRIGTSWACCAAQPGGSEPGPASEPAEPGCTEEVRPRLAKPGPDSAPQQPPPAPAADADGGGDAAAASAAAGPPWPSPSAAAAQWSPRPSPEMEPQPYGDDHQQALPPAPLLERVAPAGSRNYVQVVGYVDGAAVQVTESYTRMKIKAQYTQSTQGRPAYRWFECEGFYEVATALLSLTPGTEVAITGGLRANMHGDVVVRVDLIQLVYRTAPPGALPPPGRRDRPFAQQVQLELVEPPAYANTVKLMATLDSVGAMSSPGTGAALVTNAVVYLEPPSPTGRPVRVPVEAWDVFAEGLAHLPVGTDVAINGYLRNNREGAIIVTIKRLQVLDYNDPSLPPAGGSAARSAGVPYASGAASYTQQGSWRRDAPKEPLDGPAVHAAHYKGDKSLAQLGEAYGRERREVLDALARQAVDGHKQLHWRRLAEELGIALRNQDPEVPYPCLNDLMVIVDRHRMATRDHPPRNRDGTLRLKPIRDLAKSLADAAEPDIRDVARRFAAYERDRGDSAAYDALRLGIAADMTEGTTWSYQEQFPGEHPPSPGVRG